MTHSQSVDQMNTTF